MRGQLNLFLATYARCPNEGQRQGEARQGKVCQYKARQDIIPLTAIIAIKRSGVITPRFFSSAPFTASARHYEVTNKKDIKNQFSNQFSNGKTTKINVCRVLSPSVLKQCTKISTSILHVQSTGHFAR